MNKVEITKTTCPYCGVGCGIDVHHQQDGTFKIKPDKEHPANLGRLCSKGMNLADTLHHPERLTDPYIKGEKVDWDIATTVVAKQLSSVIKEHGKDAVAFYVSGQLLTEDYYVANKLMKGFIGSANIDTNSRLCMASAVVAHKRAFGEDIVPCSYQDLEQAKLVLLVGSNTAWCHPVIYQRLVKAKKDNPDLKIVVIDPRKTQTADIADLHLALRPGSDAYLFNGLLNWLAENEHVATDYVAQYTKGVDDTLNAAKHSIKESITKTAKSGVINNESVAQQCGLSVEDLNTFYKWFASTEQVVSLFSQGINQSSSGVDKGNAIINCHLLTGKIGKPGTGPFSITGQPNAMGGREVGGLANQLAAHMELENPQHQDIVKTFWQSPSIADQQGLKAVDLFNAIDEGKVKAVWVMGTNPAVSLPDSEKVKNALQKCECVIVSDCVRHNDTIEYADILLPIKTWGERDGTVTNSDRTISRQKPFATPPKNARADWEVITEVAHKLGFADSFPYQDSSDIFIEHAKLSGFRNNNSRYFDISGLSHLTQDEYNHLPPTQWPVPDTYHPRSQSSYPFANGQFYTDDRKARFIPVTPKMPASQTTDQYPFRLNTGRVRDQWHTMTRTGYSSILSSHRSHAFAEINPEDAEQNNIVDQQLIRIQGHQNHIIVKAQVTANQQAGTIFVPMHWNEQFSAKANVSSLIPAITDPFSGQPESKHAPVNIEAFPTYWHGFLISKRKLALDHIDYWSTHYKQSVWIYDLANQNQTTNWQSFARSLLCASDSNNTAWAEYSDEARQTYRAARLVNQQLESCIFVSPQTIPLPDHQWLLSLFAQASLSELEHRSLLTGIPPTPVEDTGQTICSCFNVGEKTITRTIKEHNLTTAEQIGEKCQAGTNCGSCLPELKALIKNSKNNRKETRTC